MESADKIYGRSHEACYVAGHEFERLCISVEKLLSSGKWREVSPGFSDVREFLGTYDLSPFNIQDRRKLAILIKKLEPTVSNRALARVAGVSRQTIDRDPTGPNGPPGDKNIPESNDSTGPNGPPTGRQVAAAAERKAEKAERQARKNQERSLTKAAAIDSKYELFCCSCAELFSKGIKPNAVITDPPYMKEYLSVYSELANAAKDVPLVAVMVGQTYLPDVLRRMCEHLKYRWTLAYITVGAGGSQHHVKVNCWWKPVLLFGESAEWIGDIYKSEGIDKEHHEWGQSESGMLNLVEKLTEPGQLVCDPFLGGGTTAMAAIKLKRHFVGCDIEQSAVEASEKRMEAYSH
jgi:hypothetical protein